MGNDNSTILQKAARITQEVDRYFEGLGMEVNYSKGKSEVLICYRGAGAAKQRKEWLLGHTNGCELQEETNNGKHLCLTAAYKHLGIYHEGAGSLDVELNHRISQAWAMWREIRTSILCCRRIQKNTRVKLAFSLIMTKLFHGAGAWPVLSRKQNRRLHICYIKILRMTTGNTYKAGGGGELQKDEVFLAKFALPTVEVKIATERLLYAARTYLHSSDLMESILQTEFDSRHDSWTHALIGSLEWLKAVQGNEWGSDLQDFKQAWKSKAGWKPFVKSAMRRHVLQEQIACAIQKNAPTVPSATTEVEQEGDFSCFCGRAFSTATSLSVHKRVMHQINAPEFWMARGSTCYTCQR